MMTKLEKIQEILKGVNSNSEADAMANALSVIQDILDEKPVLPDKEEIIKRLLKMGVLAHAATCELKDHHAAYGVHLPDGTITIARCIEKVVPIDDEYETAYATPIWLLVPPEWKDWTLLDHEGNPATIADGPPPFCN